MRYLPSSKSITAYGLYGDDGKPVAIIEFEPSANGIELIRLIAAAPLMLAALTEGIGIPESADFATDLETIANFLKAYHPISADDLRRKAHTIRAAIAAARGE